ncbi:NAD-dependent epimerase/dehydratase family protein [Luteolibacter arcticus]|uniref:NAD-dependent epimerase/dehydratase family protein n=1 Tax=Luteolibacter arcticus TaxID=1581411 RepID=A0ABT3GKC7_9BACT|nr:NAD-dependent epimerase/dehydratase family protein [Luteolibacter arcticus]MCW1923978.1 NAD-dependent epimerase/dehydratase family protein [Luteolibacter arcticus]
MPSNKPSVLVTGASGFIGSYVVRHLAAAGFEVTALDLREPVTLHPERVREIRCDLRDGALPEGGFDTIIHLAALGGVRPSMERPSDYLATNVAGTVRLLEWARQREVKRVIFASSSSVYGATDGTPSAEDDPLSPCSPYALTKVQGEQWGELYARKYGIDFLALRLFAVWGDGQRPDLALESFRRKILARETITIHGDGSQRRDLTHVSDVARAVEKSIAWTGHGFEVFNIGTGTNHSVNDMLRAAEAWAGMTTEVKYGPAHPADVPTTLADVRKAREVLGWKAEVRFA